MMLTMKQSGRGLGDSPISTRVKLSALWTATMFCYVYGDIFSMFRPTRLQNLLNGQSGVGQTTPNTLLAFAVLMSIPASMIILSLILKPVVARWLNFSVGIFFTGVMLFIGLTTISEWMMFYTYLAAVEIVLTSSVVVAAWRWQSGSESNLEGAEL